MKPKKYRKKPVVVEAIQWNGKNFEELSEFIGRKFEPKLVLAGGIPVQTVSIPMTITFPIDIIVYPDDYIIKGTRGEFYPCKPDIFKEIYDELEVDTQ